MQEEVRYNQVCRDNKAENRTNMATIDVDLEDLDEVIHKAKTHDCDFEKQEDVTKISEHLYHPKNIEYVPI